jgi:hypothetical protein
MKTQIAELEYHLVAASYNTEGSQVPRGESDHQSRLVSYTRWQYEHKRLAHCHKFHHRHPQYVHVKSQDAIKTISQFVSLIQHYYTRFVNI